MYDIESRFTVKQLKTVCGVLGLQLSGTKGPLQQRLRSYFDAMLGSKDAVRFSIGKGAVEAERGVAYGAPRVVYSLGNVELIIVGRMGIRLEQRQRQITHGVCLLYTAIYEHVRSFY